MPSLVLASGSETRQRLLRQAGVAFDIHVAPVDEPAIRASLAAEGASPRDVADVLAETKALRVSAKRPGALVLGADQVLEIDREVLAKPGTADEAVAQITRLAGQTHRLMTAAVIVQDGEPLWRHVATTRMHMAARSPEWIRAYVARNWPAIGSSVGGYRIEEEGIRLFTRIEGDYFAILGLPLLEVLTYLTLRGVLES